MDRANGLRASAAGATLEISASMRPPRSGIATWLLTHAADWLRLARVDRLLAYAWPEGDDCIQLLDCAGFRELTRNQRGWTRPPGIGLEIRHVAIAETRSSAKAAALERVIEA